MPVFYGIEHFLQIHGGFPNIEGNNLRVHVAVEVNLYRIAKIKSKCEAPAWLKCCIPFMELNVLSEIGRLQFLLDRYSVRLQLQTSRHVVCYSLGQVNTRGKVMHTCITVSTYYCYDLFLPWYDSGWPPTALPMYYYGLV